MRDWKAIAKAQGLPIPAEEIDQTLAPLAEMEEIFRSLIPELAPENEPAFDVRLEAGE
jgi:hypothetical protein